MPAQKHTTLTRREMKQVKFYMTEEDKKMIEEVALMKGLNRQELFEQWIATIKQQ